MPTTGLQYPPGAPSITGNKITVERFLRNPSQVYKTLADMTLERFIGDFIYASGDAMGGAVLYDRIDENDLYADRDPSPIAPGDEFPLVNDVDKDPFVAAVTKRGAAMVMTYEAVRRDARDVLARGLLKLRNTSTRKHDAIAVATAYADPATIVVPATDSWGSGVNRDVVGDLFAVQSAVEDQDLGYMVDTCILTPADALKMIRDKDIRDQLPRESPTLNPVVSGRLSGLCGIPNWIVTNRATTGTPLFMQRQVAGSQRDEVPFYTRVVNDEKRERWIVMAGRVGVPIITDPKAIVKLTGV